MPPSPAYNLLCVLCSTASILSHAARFRASQVATVTQQKWDSANKPPKTNASAVNANSLNGGTNVEGRSRDEVQERHVPSFRPRVELASVKQRIEVREEKSVADASQESMVSQSPILQAVDERPSASFPGTNSTDVRASVEGREVREHYVAPSLQSSVEPSSVIRNAQIQDAGRVIDLGQHLENSRNPPPHNPHGQAGSVELDEVSLKTSCSEVFNSCTTDLDLLRLCQKLLYKSCLYLHGISSRQRCPHHG